MHEHGDRAASGSYPAPVSAMVDALRNADTGALRDHRADGYIELRPLTAEMVRGRDGAAELEAADPRPGRKARIRRIAGRDELWTIESFAEDAGASDGFRLTILELQGDRIGGATVYDLDRLEAPAWRAAHVTALDGNATPPELPPTAELSGAELRRLIDRYWRAQLQRDDGELRRCRSDDWTMDWPQTGERVPSHAADMAIHGTYPGYPNIDLRNVATSGEGWELSPMFAPVRIHGAGALVAIEGINTYPSGEVWHVAALLETGGGRVRRDTQYFGRPAEPEPWRAPWTERFDARAPR